MLDLLFHAFYIRMPLLWKNSNYAVAVDQYLERINFLANTISNNKCIFSGTCASWMKQKMNN